MVKSNHKMVVISILDNFEKKCLSISTLQIKVLILNTRKVDVAMIDTNTYLITCKLKKAWVFIVSMKNLKY